MLLNPDSPGLWQREMAQGGFDSFIYDELYKWGDLPGQTVWDVGAHVGYHTLAMACLVGSSGHVVAFEPNPHNLERLRANLDRNPDLGQRVIIVDSALSQNDGEMKFVQSSDVDGGRSSGSHLAEALLPLVESVYESFTETLVRCVKADTLLASGVVPVPYLIKVDVEGAEHLVLNGAQDLLSNFRPFLFIEVHNVSAMFHVEKSLFGLGYSVEILDAEHVSPSRCFILAKPAKEP
jgi:FkbM family methyltransferase